MLNLAFPKRSTVMWPGPALWFEVFALLGQLLGVALVGVIIVLRAAILRLLGITTLPPQLIALLGVIGVVAVLSGGRALLWGSRSLLGGFKQRLILTPDGFVVDGGPSRAVPFADITRIEQRNRAFLFTRRESLSSGYWGLRITYHDGDIDTWQVDYRFGRPWEVEALIQGAFAQYQRAHGLA
jgi:hypothetical protein